MTFPLPLFIDVGSDTVNTLLACAKRVKGFRVGGAKVRAAVAAVEQLVRDRQPADSAVIERVFKQGYVANWEDIVDSGTAEVSVEQVTVLLAYARREVDHVAWCFVARDDEDFERQLPADSVDVCPVCHSAYEIEKHARQARAWRRAFIDGAGGVTHHEKCDAERGEAPGQKPG